VIEGERLTETTHTDERDHTVRADAWHGGRESEFGLRYDRE